MHESAAGAETLVLVLGDQLTPSLPALAGAERRTAVVLMAEVADEATYVRHHRKKLAFVFAAMRHYAEELRAAGWRVDYVTLEDSTNTGSLGGELTRAVRRWNARRVRATEAGEWRVRAMQREWQSRLGVQVDVLPDTRFVCREADFADWAGQRTQLRMEYF
jgi:deoxyribodipyrimidine photolyase-related protein